MTSPYPPSQPGPRPGPPSPGNFRPGPPAPGGFRPGPRPGYEPPAAVGGEAETTRSLETSDAPRTPGAPTSGDGGTGHPAVDAALRSLANASGLAPAEQIAAYEDAHRLLQETLASIDG